MKAYEYLLEFKDRASSSVKRVAREMGLSDNQAQKLEKSVRGVNTEFAKTEKRGLGLSRMFGGLRGTMASLLTVTTLLAGGANLSKKAAEFEQIGIAFETMLGSAERSSKTIRDLNEFSNVTPFTNDQVFKASKSLLAYGIQAEELIPTLTALGDISAGVGTEKLPQLILAFGQVKAATRLTGMELRQFTEAGVPLLDELAKVTGKSVSVIKEDLIPSGKIGFDLVKEALFNATREGGKFYQLMEKQSQSFGGRISTLQGKLGLLGVAYGESLNQRLRPAVELAIDLTDSLIIAAKSNNELYAEQAKKVSQLEGEYRPRLNRYQDLITKTTRTKDEEVELKTITEKLGDALPGIVTKWNRFGEAIELSGDAFERFSGLQKDYRDQLNRGAKLDLIDEFNTAKFRAGRLYSQLNYADEQTYQKNIFGLIKKSYNEKNQFRIADENLKEYKSLIGDEKGFGSIGLLINQMRELNGLEALTAKQIADFNGLRTKYITRKDGVKGHTVDFSLYEELFTKDFKSGGAGSGGSGGTGGVDSDIKDGIEEITAGGGRSVTINFNAPIKFAESIDITAQDLSDGLDQLEPKMREFFVRLLQGGLHTVAGS